MLLFMGTIALDFFTGGQNMTEHNTRLSSSEVSSLWSAYQNNTMFIRPPYVSTIYKYLRTKQSYLGGLLNLNRRPLNVIEITHLKANLETNVVGQTLLTGFSQVAGSKKGISNYATSSAASLRMDLATNYVRLTAEIAQYAQDGATILIDNGWLEEPPQNVDRKELAKL
jgi:hypothetical protein